LTLTIHRRETIRVDDSVPSFRASTKSDSRVTFAV
jgi:hypothetical protein